MNLPVPKFNSFKEAIGYRYTCPLCTSNLYINDRDLARDLINDHGHESSGDTSKISFFISLIEKDTISIDLETDEVQIIFNDRMSKTIWTGPGTPKIQAPPIYNGRFMHGLTIDCKNCCQYSFTLQIHFNLLNKVLSGIYLNSETISIEDGNIVHEIKNSYAAQVTYYSYFMKDGDSKKLPLPLIPLNLLDPKETVARIRNLLIFS